MTDTDTRTWRALPTPGRLVYDLERFPYPAPGTRSGIGYAHLRLFEVRDHRGYIAVLRELPGELSLATGAEHIWCALRNDFTSGHLTQIEHYPTPEPGRYRQYNGYRTFTGHRWRPLSDIHRGHLDHDQVTAWWAANAHTITTADAPLYGTRDDIPGLRK